MSYDIWLEADLGGPEPVSLGNWNYTSNCVPMWRLGGANLAEYDGKPARDCLPSLRVAVAAMEADPNRFRKLDPPNGWGSADTLLPALRELVVLFESAPAATVKVGR